MHPPTTPAHVPPRGPPRRADLEVRPDPQAVATSAAFRFVGAYHESLDRGNKRFSVALAGGSTPAALYKLLASDAWKGRVDWPSVDVYFGDERRVGPDHDRSNYRAARETLLDHVPVDPARIFRMRGEDDPEAAAQAYDDLLADRFGDGGGLDLLLLGMGDDAHTLSLFPHTRALDERDRRCVANFVPQLGDGGEWRITLTAAFANRSRSILGLVTGRSKGEAARQLTAPDGDPHEHPIRLIRSPEAFTVILDAAAAGLARES